MNCYFLNLIIFLTLSNLRWHMFGIVGIFESHACKRKEVISMFFCVINLNGKIDFFT